MKKIQFYVDPAYPHASLLIPPVPAISMIPDWYKESEAFINKDTARLDIPDKSLRSPGLKSCVPVFDSLVSGYFFVTWCDVEIYKNRANQVEWRYVVKDENEEWVPINENIEMIGERIGEMAHAMPRPAGHSYNHMIWKGRFGTKLPKGWSLMVVHPFHRHDLPFTTVPGFIDSDMFTGNGNLPFFLKNNWTGIIERGTPFAQIIPIKRESWISKIIPFDKDKIGRHLINNLRSVPYGYYRNKVWERKVYDANYDFKKK